jgi:predicted porin
MAEITGASSGDVSVIWVAATASTLWPLERKMIGGSMKMTSRFALVAAAGLLFGATVAPANAADLGGGCCADLEERVAELEATTARKGNRVVSLQIYGQVNKALLFFDDGEDSDVFVVDNDNSNSRFGFQGTASISQGVTAGYNIEIGLNDANSNAVSADNDEGSVGDLFIRKNELYIESERLGRVTIGQGSNAGDGITGIVLGNSQSTAALDFGAGLDETLGATVSDLGTSRSDRVRYDTPSIYGFIVSASWGEDDLVDVALRFKKEWNSIRIAAGIAYASQTDDNPGSDDAEFEQISGSISVMHVPTGIYGAFSAGEREISKQDNGAPIGDGDGTVDVDKEHSFWYAQLGIEKRIFAPGSTTVYVDYGQYEIDDNDLNASDTVDRFGFGVVQSIDSAAMDVYAHAAFFDIDDAGVENDVTTVMVGSIIKF